MEHDLYLFTKHKKLMCRRGNFTSSIDLDSVYKFAKSSEFVESTYGDGVNGADRIVDDDVRRSELSTMKFYLGNITFENIKVDDIKYKFTEMFEFVKYNVGGHFAEHTDRSRHRGHTHTVCVYPPQNIDGGELILNKNITLKMSNEKWTMIIFPIDVVHVSMPVKKGVKYLFKGTMSLKNKVIKPVETEDVPVKRVFSHGKFRPTDGRKD
jgi:hypothetical protein